LAQTVALPAPDLGSVYPRAEQPTRLLAAAGERLVALVHDEALWAQARADGEPAVGRWRGPARRFTTVAASASGAWAVDARGGLVALEAFPEGGARVVEIALDGAAEHIAAVGRHLYVSVPGQGLLAFRVAMDGSATRPIALGRIAGMPVGPLPRVRHLTVDDGRVAAATDQPESIYVACVDPAGGPTRYHDVPRGDRRPRVDLDGGWLWSMSGVFGRPSELRGQRVTDACRVDETGTRFLLPGFIPTTFAVADGVAALVGGPRLELLDVRDPSQPVPLDASDLPDSARGVAVADARVWVTWAGSEGGLTQLRLGTDSRLDPLGDVVTGRVGGDPAAAGGQAWVLLDSGALAQYAEATVQPPATASPTDDPTPVATVPPAATVTRTPAAGTPLPPEGTTTPPGATPAGATPTMPTARSQLHLPYALQRGD
jgi:hypothetical protein